jgi:hypothetical protein
MTNQAGDPETPHTDWKNLYRVGGAAALLAGVLFRRNWAAEIDLYFQHPPPVNVDGWYALLQENRLLGLAHLGILDVVNYVLLALMFLALYFLLRKPSKSAMAVALTLALVGIAVYMASDTALSMLALSDQYAAATTDARRTALLAAGEATLALTRFGAPGAHPGSGGYISLLLVAIAGIITSAVMLRSRLFNPPTSIVGLVAGALDVAYCVAYAFLPGVESELISVLFIPAAGLFTMIWHIMVGWRLFKLGKG